jgi:hypothetical protein
MHDLYMLYTTGRLFFPVPVLFDRLSRFPALKADTALCSLPMGSSALTL